MLLLNTTSDLFLSDRKKDPEHQTLTQVKNNLVLVVSLPELSAGRRLNASFVFSLCCQWERLQTVPLYAYEGLRARVSAVSICSASQIPLCVCVWQTQRGCSDSLASTSIYWTWTLCKFPFNWRLPTRTKPTTLIKITQWYKNPHRQINNIIKSHLDKCLKYFNGWVFFQNGSHVESWSWATCCSEASLKVQSRSVVSAGCKLCTRVCDSSWSNSLQPELLWEVDTLPFPELAAASHGTSALIRLHLTRPLFVFLHWVIYQPVMRSKTLSGHSDSQPAFRAAGKYALPATGFCLCHQVWPIYVCHGKWRWSECENTAAHVIIVPIREAKKIGNDNNVTGRWGSLKSTVSDF